MRRTVRSSLVALTVLASALAATAADAAITGSNLWVAFDSRRNGDADIFRVAPSPITSGPRERLLAASVPGANDARPAWAPEAPFSVVGLEPEGERGLVIFGNRLADVTSVRVGTNVLLPEERTDSFVKVTVPPDASPSSEICVRQELGFVAAPRMLVAAGMFSPAVWECASQPIAFQSDRSGDYDVWVHDPSLPLGPENPVNVTAAPGSHETAPAWSPSNTRSLGQSSVRSNPLLAFESDRLGSRDIFVLDLRRPLGPDNPVPAATGPGDEANPDWSPDGRHIVFESDRLGPKDLWSIAVPAAGPSAPNHELRQLTSDVEPSYDPSLGAMDSRETGTAGVTVLTFSGPEEDTGDCELNMLVEQRRAVVPGLDSEMWTIPNPATTEDAPALAPFGSPLAFQSLRGGNEDIYVQYTDDERPDETIPLTSHPAADRHPNWQAGHIDANLGYYRPVGRKTKRKRRSRASASADRRPCSRQPDAAVTSSPPRPEPGEAVTFDAAGSSDTDGPIEHYEWDLDDDGTFETRGVRAARSFPREGVYDVTLRIVDQDGASRRLRRQVGVGITIEQPCTSTGTAGPDVLAGTPGDDVLCGLGGDDVIYGEAGNDVILGGDGDDRLFGGVGNDSVRGEAGQDTATGNAGDDLVRGEAGRDTLKGGAGADRLVGGADKDTVSGGAGADRARGDGGRDRLSGGSDRDSLKGGAGGDRLFGGKGPDTLVGSRGGDRLTGGKGSDRLRGGRGRDRLRARDGLRDIVRGGPQRDRARIDPGLDVVRGVEVRLLS